MDFICGQLLSPAKANCFDTYAHTRTLNILVYEFTLNGHLFGFSLLQTFNALAQLSPALDGRPAGQTSVPTDRPKFAPHNKIKNT